MNKFTVLDGLVAPMDRPNVDTDLIIPKQFLKSIKRTGFGANLFDELRYLDEGAPDKDNQGRPLNPEFPLNFSRYQGAAILLSRENFGCGSSREHAPWALEEYGFRCVIASSFADIFYNNCFKNGMLPVALDATVIDTLMSQVYDNEGYRLTVDLVEQCVISASGEKYSFEVDEFRKHCLLNGLDEISLTLQESDAIRDYETKRQMITPWVFN